MIRHVYYVELVRVARAGAGADPGSGVYTSAMPETPVK